MKEGGLLTAPEVDGLVDRLESSRSALRAMDRMERTLLLGGVAETWLADVADLDETAKSIAQATGYAPPMVSVCLRRTLEAWSTRPLRELTEEAFLAPGSTPTAPDFSVAVLAQNTPGLAIAPTFTALAVGAPLLLKCARGEDGFAPRLVERIRAASPILGAALSSRLWAGGDPLEKRLFGRAGRVVVYGPREAIENARRLAGERVISRGPRVSLAVIADGQDLDSVAEGLSCDIAMLDQRGCLSPQAILVAEHIDRRDLARRLGEALTARETQWPRRRLSLPDATAFRHAFQEAEEMALREENEEVLGGLESSWAVATTPDSKIQPSPLDRFVRLHPFRDASALATSLAPLQGHLECVSLEATAATTREIEEVIRRAGASRVCRIGTMQAPPAAWHAGARRPLDDYLLWSGQDEEESPVLDLRARFLRSLAQTSGEPRALDVEHARGSWVYTRDGRRHLDLLAGIGVASIGHSHPAVAAAVARQSTRYTHVMVYGEDALTPQIELAERLAKLLPSQLGVSYFTNSGAEAIEGAIKLVRKATGRDRILSFEGAYHGDTTGAMAIGGNSFYREPFAPLLGPVEHLPWNQVEHLQRIDTTTAAVFAEPVQAEGGVRLPAPDFLVQLAKRCREVGALLVFDEVVTGLGRTGRWFGFEHWPGCEPDVLVLAKSLGGGLPLGAFVSSPELLRVLAQDPPLGHVTTFGGNPISCAAGLAALDVLAQQDLPARAARVGATLRDRLSSFVGNGLTAVRGLGLLIGLEFNRPQSTAAFAAACREGGLLLGWTLHEDRVVRLAPPLTIGREEIDYAVEIMGRALEHT